MKLEVHRGLQDQTRVPPRAGADSVASGREVAAFSLLEVMIVMLLLTISFIAALTAIFFDTQASYRVADHSAVITLVQAKLEAVRAATYNPPSTNFGAAKITFTNTHSIALNKAGSNYVVTGTLVTKIEPVTSGHLVTVTGTFPTPRLATVVEMQTVVNQYSGGQK